jgi:hypothetical protein
MKFHFILPTVDDVYDYWGKQEVDVYVVERGDGNLTEEQVTELNENESLQVFREQIIKETPCSSFSSHNE